MNEQTKAQLTDAKKMLDEAKELNTSSAYGKALTCAYKASEIIAAAYLLDAIKKAYPVSDKTYDLFNEKVRNPERHKAFTQEIGDIVGDVTVLRETYVPALLDETTEDDTHLMIDRVLKLHALVVRMVG